MPILRKAKKELENINAVVAEATRATTKLIPRSGFTIRPGDILLFKYDKSANWFRVALVVSNKTGKGVFVSTRSNLLVSSFTLSEEGETMRIILRTLYKNRRKSSYETIINGLKALLGRNSYRTFNLDKMHSIYNLNLNVKSL